MEWSHDLYQARQYNSPRLSYDMFTFNTGPIHITSASPYPGVSQNDEDRETLHEGFSETTTPPTTPLSPEAVAVKVINPEKKSESKLLMLRNVDYNKLDSPRALKHLILDQFGGEIVPGNLKFDVGYYRGNKRVCLVSVDDMEDVNKLLRSTDGHEVTLWCMGCTTKTTKQKGKRTWVVSDMDSANDSSSKSERPAKKSKKKSRYADKLERVDETIDTLKSKHGLMYTNIQYRVWAEAIDSGNHDSFDSPPKGSFFKSQGRKSKSTTSTSGSHSTSTSIECQESESTLSLTPQKAAQLKSTYIQQIKELHTLQELGAITGDHFIKQRDILLEQMTKMQ